MDEDKQTGSSVNEAELPPATIVVSEVIRRLELCRRDGWDEVDVHVGIYINELKKLV